MLPKVSDIRPLGTRMLVRKYVRPERIGSLYVPPSFDVDNSRSLWEVVKSTEKANKYLGVGLQEGDLLVTLPNRGVYVEVDDAAEHYFLFAEEVVKYIPKTW